MKVKIQTKRCIEVAEHIRHSGGVSDDREDSMKYNFPKRIVHNGWCAIVAINHQTTPIVGLALHGTVNGIKLKGWDYLLQKAIFMANKDPAMFTVGWLCSVTSDTLREIYFDEEDGETLNQTEARRDLLIDLGDFLRRNKWNSVAEIYKQSQGFIVKSDGRGIAQILSQARAYQDPVQKKMFYFLAVMRNQKLWEYKDILNLSAPVNYHEQRGHLRLGTVTIEDSALEKRIRDRQNISEEDDIEIRLAVRRAIEFIAQYLDATPSMMHYYFWNHIRNCCSRDNPHCNDCGGSCGLPDRYRTGYPAKCVFSNICPSALLKKEDMLIEPRLDSTIWQ